MKKWGKYFRKAALTAAVCLGLSQSVWAMPTGGTVTAGRVIVNGNGFIGGVFKDGVTVSVVENAIINWNSFGIEAGKSLNVDTTNGALLNRVIGGNVSEIYGALNQTGTNPMFLVNPSGILVGNGATINASNLILSTLAISNQNFFDVTENQANCQFATPKGKTIAAPVAIKGAKINIDGKEFIGTGNVGRFTAIGGTVEVADGVTFSTGFSYFQLAAAQTAKVPLSSYSGINITATENNVLSFVDSQVCRGNNRHSKFALYGGGINLKGATMDYSPNGDIFIGAYSSGVDDNGLKFRFSSPNHAITIQDSSLHAGGELWIQGGKVDVSNSTLKNTSADEDNILIVADASETYGAGTETYQMGGAEHSVTLKDTIVESAAEDVWIAGGKVTLDGVRLTGKANVAIAAVESASCKNASYNSADVWTGTTGADNTVAILGDSSMSAANRLAIGGREVSVPGRSTLSAGQELSVKAGSAGTMKDFVITLTGTAGEIPVSTDSKLLQNGADVTDKFATSRPAPAPKPEPQPEPQPAPVPQLDEDVQKNMESGAAAMSEVLTTNKTPEARLQATRVWVERIRQAAATDTQKAAQITGALQAIREDKSLSDAEKTALQNEIVAMFDRTRQANIELNHSVVNATQKAGDTQTDRQPASRGTGDAVVPPAEEADESPVHFS